MDTPRSAELAGESSVDTVVMWGWNLYRDHLELLYPFGLLGVFTLFLELRLEFITELYDLDEGLQFSVDSDVTRLLSDRVADALVPVLEEVVWLVVLGVFALGFLTAVIGLLAVGIAFLVAADDLGGRDRSQFQRARQALRRLPALVGASFVAGLLVGVGLLLLVVPGLYLATRFALAGPAIVIDGYGPITGLRTSCDAVSGQFRGVLLLVLLGVVLLTLVGVIPIVGELLAVLVVLPVFSLSLALCYIE